MDGETLVEPVQLADFQRVEFTGRPLFMQTEKGAAKMKPVFAQSSWPICYQVTSEMIQIHSDRPLRVLTSAIMGGEEQAATLILNRHVQKSYCPPDPEAEVKEWLNGKRISTKGTVVLLTAAYVDQADFRVQASDGFRIAVWATAGVGNAARAGVEGMDDSPGKPGTINLVLVIDGELTQAAMVNSIITATEAKSAALQDLAVTDSAGNIATGTTTDAIVVAATQQRVGSVLHRYAGVASPLGQVIGRLVYRAVREAVLNEKRIKQKGIVNNGSRLDYFCSLSVRPSYR
ncbi:adenosylcobinamide amidohydrolase [Paenactinomyces guangxiensis]|nr:adenosylcobinamide amidohydrolase [Paenactinomyces guangxiensis]